MNLDWRDMFKNYVDTVRAEEGIDFLDRAGSPWNSTRAWTEQERQAIVDLTGRDIDA